MRITRKWKNILSIGLAVLVLFGAVGAVAAFATNDMKTITPVFAIGSIDPATGEYVEDDISIYTKDAFPCGALRVEPDFDFDGTYDIFYYSADHFLVGKITDKTGVYDMNEMGQVGEYARIVIHPTEPADYDDNKGKDPWKINWYDIFKYSSKVTIKVGKDGFEYRDFINLWEVSGVLTDVSHYSSDGTVSETLIEDYHSKTCENIELHKDYERIDIMLKFTYPPQQGFAVVFYDDTGNVVYTLINELTNFEKGLYRYIDAIPEGATKMSISVPKDATVFVYGITD